MLLTITPTTGPVVNLSGTIPAEEVQNFQVQPQSNTQEVQALLAASAAYLPRGNKRNTVTFRIEREHDTAEIAAFFCVDHDIQFPVQGLFAYTTDEGKRWMANAEASVTQYSFEGATTIHTYRVVGGAFLTSAPTF